MLDSILLDLDPYFLSWVSWLNVTLFVILFVVSLWGIIKGRSVCYLIALAAMFMFIDRTLVVNTIDVLKKREFASEAKSLGVCSEFKDVNYKDVNKKEMRFSDDMSAEEIKALGFDYENDDMFCGGNLGICQTKISLASAGKAGSISHRRAGGYSITSLGWSNHWKVGLLGSVSTPNWLSAPSTCRRIRYSPGFTWLMGIVIEWVLMIRRGASNK